jgi:hypothetical protein
MTGQSKESKTMKYTGVFNSKKEAIEYRDRFLEVWDKTMPGSFHFRVLIEHYKEVDMYIVRHDITPEQD